MERTRLREILTWNNYSELFKENDFATKLYYDSEVTIYYRYNAVHVDFARIASNGRRSEGSVTLDKQETELLIAYLQKALHEFPEPKK